MVQTVRDCLSCAMKGVDCFCRLSPETLTALQTLGSFASVPEGMGGVAAPGSAMSFRMPLTHEELGNMAGLSRETVTRTLTKFRREGLVEQKGERMVLPDPAAMEERYG
jgi:CRP-like cAMP-binding protein